MNPLSALAEFAVKRWQFTVLLFLMFAALGVSSWMAIPRAEDPDFPVPIFTVVAVYPGASPEDMEQLVTDPVEKQLKTLTDVIKLESTSSDGLSVVRVEFDPDVDAERKYDQVVREVNALRPTLPAALNRLDIQRNENSDLTVFQVALVAPSAPFTQVDDIAKRLEDALEQVPGVKHAKRWAAPPREMQVTLDLGRLARLGITPSQVLNALGSDNTQIPGGSVDVGTRRYNVATTGRYRTAADVERTVIAGANGAMVRVQDVATVSWGDGDPVHMGRWNGERAMWVTVAVQKGQNVSSVKQAVWQVLDEFEPTLPKSVTLARGFDQSENVDRRLARLGEDFVIAILLVLITLLPLGTRASIIVMISIPLSLAMAVTMLYATGFSINQLSIVGFVIALGLLVDDSIVVVENISRFLRQGYSRTAAAIEATKQIGVAVVGATGTLIFAFLPLLFLPGLAGKYIRSLPIAVVYAVLASLFVSLTIIPWLASRLMPRTESEHGNRALQWLDRAIHRTYAPLLGRAMARPYVTLAVSALLIVGAVALVPAVGFSLFPKAGTPQYHVDIATPDGTSLAETNRAVRYAEGVIGAHPSTRAVLANVGKDNPAVYYNVFQRAEAPNRAQMLVLLNEYDNVRTPVVLDSLREKLALYPGARIELKEFENGPPIDAPIAMRVEGTDLDTLQHIAAQYEAVLASTAGTQYVNNPVRLRRSDLQLVVDKQKAGLLGVPSAEVERTLRLGIAGLEAGKIRADNGEEYPLMVRIAHQGRPAPEALERIFVSSVTGAMVPLSQLATTRFEASPTTIDHKDRQRSVTVTSYVRSGFNTDAVTRTVIARLDSIALPAGYTLHPAGEIESREESFGGIGSAIIVAVFAILAILVLEFRDFRTTLVVASVIPLGVVGGIVALLFSGYTLSFTAMIGFVALVGIEIKTSILLVDFTDQLRREGVPLDEAIRRAGEIRFLPIVLTTFTAIGGLLPLAVQGSGLYSPLAWVIIGGLVSSTLIARLVTPVLYKLLAPALDVETTTEAEPMLVGPASVSPAHA
ncbi:MAG TPA: AcrB/AcrD/AcrF family protein [Gemmatimonas aurantiaca]|uniref:Multidrug resistance protein n=2 Tax=Gemmatimonas aurantiaca TaxID=173480 RepID=C1AE68_GEMAT|nr:efflux RND transporter permease subunit [Gemmatimonas aurantiaca]BAH40795.1 multidrug resistance protein [Gemmatimonas aurantiaca T-27]HCT59110.1 AcrB/AcrD/AcrF family protein [Gemmatimonas aurantiaca]